jgi:hypothetical protein
MRGMSAGDQRLGGSTSGVDAGSAEEIALDIRDLPTSFCEFPGKGRSSLPRAYNDCVKLRHQVLLLPVNLRPLHAFGRAPI